MAYLASEILCLCVGDIVETADGEKTVSGVTDAIAPGKQKWPPMLKVSFTDDTSTNLPGVSLIHLIKRAENSPGEKDANT